MEILASVEDINNHLPSKDSGGTTSGYPVVVEATDENTTLLQVSVARMVRGYLSSAVDSTTLMGWDEPNDPPTPSIITEVASMLIAAQLYFNHAARTSLTIDERNFAQLLYDRAIGILDKILAGEILLGAEVAIETEAMSGLDFHPVDDTDRAFTMGMNL